MTGIYNGRNYIQFGLLDPKATTFGNILKKANSIMKKLISLNELELATVRLMVW